MAYAAETGVSVERSQREIENMVRAAGAKTFYRGEDLEKAFVAFDLKDRRILFELPLPKPAAFAYFERRGRKVKATEDQMYRAVDQATRAKWRALSLTIKAKLVSTDAGIESIEEAFLAQIVVTDNAGRTARFSKFAERVIKNSYAKGLPALPSGPSNLPIEPIQLEGGE